MIYRTEGKLGDSIQIKLHLILLLHLRVNIKYEIFQQYYNIFNAISGDRSVENVEKIHKIVIKKWFLIFKKVKITNFEKSKKILLASLKFPR